MSEQFYYNYNGDDRGAFSVENNSIVFKIKRAILDGVKNAEVSLRKKVRKNGNNYFKHKLLSKKIPRAYRAAAKNPVDENKIVFVEIRLPYLTNSLQIMFDELANNYDYNIHTHFLLNGNTIRAIIHSAVLTLLRILPPQNMCLSTKAQMRFRQCRFAPKQKSFSFGTVAARLKSSVSLQPI